MFSSSSESFDKGILCECMLTSLDYCIPLCTQQRADNIFMARKTHLDSGRLRFLYVTWAVLETMLFGGLMNGWASLVFILKEDGMYRDLCENNNSLTLLGEYQIFLSRSNHKHIIS